MYWTPNVVGCKPLPHPDTLDHRALEPRFYLGSMLNEP